MTAKGLATAADTSAFAQRMVADGIADEHFFRLIDGLTVSSIGLGTYLGDTDDEIDLLYTEAVVAAIERGCNLIDTAVNYRFQRSERAIGVALERLFTAGKVARSEVVVATKAGYVPFDGERPSSKADFQRYLSEQLFDAGVCEPRDMCSNLQHCITPAYLEHHLKISLENLGLESVDVFYIHNPETQQPEVGRDEFERRIRLAFAFLETKVVEGYIGRYGVATWNGFRVNPDDRAYLSIGRLAEIARDVGGDSHHFRVVQLPYNLAMTEAYGLFNQSIAGESLSLVEAAKPCGVSVVASASLLQARLTGTQPPEVSTSIPRETGAQQALEFARSTPGIAAALVGMSHERHVRENLALRRFEPVSGDLIRQLFE